jgi:hypothetical protein
MARRKSEKLIVASIKRIGAKRIVVSLIVTVLGGWATIALTVSGLARNKSPQVALMVIPGESNALANRADELLLANPTKPPAAANRLARAALNQQAINAKAVRQLGYLADTMGDKQRALAFVQLAGRLSRREPGAQLWLIEYYAQANDTVKTLNHYDILLTTKPDTQAVLYPRLSNAIEDAPIRAALLRYIQQGKPWTAAFIWHAINSDKDLTNVVNLMIEAKGLTQDDKTVRAQEVSLLGRLISEKRFTDAQRIHALIPGAKSARLANPGFDDSDRSARFGAMGWQIADDPNAGGGFLGKDGQASPALSIFANSATTKTVASRLLYLSPGSYDFRAKLLQLQRGEGGYVRFQLRCPTSDDGMPIWIFDIDPKRTAARIDVPSNCPVQFLDIVGSGGEGQLGMEATINSVAITKQTQ